MKKSIEYLIFLGMVFSSLFMMTTKFSNNGFALFSVPFLVLYFVVDFLFFKQRIDYKTLIFSVSVILILILNLLFTYSIWYEDDAQLKRFSFCIIGVTIYFTSSHLLKNWNNDAIVRALNIFLLISIVIFIIQLICYYIFNFNFDVSSMLGGEGNRAITFENVYRGTGVYDEPAIYSLFVGFLVIVKILFRGKLDILSCVAILSMFVSLSFVGILLAAGIIFLCYFGDIKSIFKILLIISLSVFIVYSFDLYPDFLLLRIDNLFSGGDGSTLNKMHAFQYWWEKDSVRLAGYGFIGLRDWTPHFFDAIYDMTFFGSALVQFGFYLFPFILLWLILFFYFNHKNALNLLLTLLIFIKLSAIYYLIFWLYLALYQRAARDRVYK